MNLWEEAAAFQAARASQASDKAPEVFDPRDSSAMEALIAELRHLYDNATRQEVERALESVLEILDPPYQKKDILKKIQSKLED